MTIFDDICKARTQRRIDNLPHTEVVLGGTVYGALMAELGGKNVSAYTGTCWIKMPALDDLVEKDMKILGMDIVVDLVHPDRLEIR